MSQPIPDILELDFTETKVTDNGQIYPDTPSAVDKFQTHEKISQTLSQLITNNSTALNVRLKGHYGSGKSTIIHLLMSKYKTAETHYVLFDAWIHNGDILRYAFFETLITSYFQQTKGQLPKIWQNKLYDLRGQTSRETKETSQYLSYQSIITIISLVISQLSISIFKDYLQDSFFLLILLQCTPIIVVVILYLTELYKTILLLRDKLEIPQLADIYHHLSSQFTTTFPFKRENEFTTFLKNLGLTTITPAVSIFSIASGTTANKANSNISKSPTPTSLLFEEYYKDFLKELYDANPKQKLIVVLDNIDRLTSNERDTIWSTIATFSSIHSSSQSSAFLIPWYIVPHSIEDEVSSEAKHYSSSNPKNNTGKLKDSVQLATNKVPEKADPYSKLFQLTIDIPLPRFSNWQHFLRERLYQIDQTIAEEDFHRLVRLWIWKWGGTATPRDAILFLNSFSYYWRRAKRNKISATSTFYYCIESSSTESFNVEVLASTLDEAAIELSGLTAQVLLCELYAVNYGSDIGFAEEQMYSGEVDAFLSNSIDESQIKSKTLEFWNILNLRSDSELDVLLSPRNAMQIARTIYRENCTSMEIIAAVKRLVLTVCRIEELFPYEDGFTDTLRFCQKHQLPESFNELLSKTLNDKSRPNRAPEDMRSYCTAFSRCFQLPDALSYTNKHWRQFNSDILSVNDILQVYDLNSREPQFKPHHFRLTDNEDTRAALLNFFSISKYNLSSLNALTFLASRMSAELKQFYLSVSVNKVKVECRTIDSFSLSIHFLEILTFEAGHSQNFWIELLEDAVVIDFLDTQGHNADVITSALILSLLFVDIETDLRTRTFESILTRYESMSLPAREKFVDQVTYYIKRFKSFRMESLDYITNLSTSKDFLIDFFEKVQKDSTLRRIVRSAATTYFPRTFVLKQYGDGVPIWKILYSAKISFSTVSKDTELAKNLLLFLKTGAGNQMTAYAKDNISAYLQNWSNQQFTDALFGYGTEHEVLSLIAEIYSPNDYSSVLLGHFTKCLSELTGFKAKTILRNASFLKNVMIADDLDRLKSLILDKIKYETGGISRVATSFLFFIRDKISSDEAHSIFETYFTSRLKDMQSNNYYESLFIVSNYPEFLLLVPKEIKSSVVSMVTNSRSQYERLFGADYITALLKALRKRK